MMDTQTGAGAPDHDGTHTPPAWWPDDWLGPPFDAFGDIGDAIDGAASGENGAEAVQDFLDGLGGLADWAADWVDDWLDPWLDDAILYLSETPPETIAADVLETIEAIIGSEAQDSLTLDMTRDSVELDLGAAGALTLTLPERGDTLILDVERLSFADGTLILDLDEAACQVYRLYTAGLGRTPDETGLRYWNGMVEDGLGLREAAEAFLDSFEFTESLGTDDPTAGDYVDAFYENVLGREAEGPGRDFWVDVLEGPLADAADVLMQFADSAENIARQAENCEDGFWVV